MPGGAHIPKWGRESARMMEYGGELLWHFSDAFIALKGGPIVYNLREAEAVEGEIAGVRRGTGGGIEVGSLQKTGRNQSWQISLAYFYILLQSPELEQSGSRHMHQIGLQARYTFGGLFKQLFQSTLFDHFF